MVSVANPDCVGSLDDPDVRAFMFDDSEHKAFMAITGKREFNKFK